jgi:hypothetical protein
MDQFILNMYSNKIEECEPEFMILFNSIYEKALEMKLHGAIKTNWDLYLEDKFEPYDPECNPDIDLDKWIAFEEANMNVPDLKDGEIQIVDKWKSLYFNAALQTYAVMKSVNHGWMNDIGDGFNYLPNSFLNELFSTMGYPNIICTDEGQYTAKFIYDSDFMTDEMEDEYINHGPKYDEVRARIFGHCTPRKTGKKYSRHYIGLKVPVMNYVFGINQWIYRDVFDDSAKEHLSNTVSRFQKVFKNFGTMEVKMGPIKR